MQSSGTQGRRAGVLCQAAGCALLCAIQSTTGTASESRADMRVRAAVPLHATIVEVGEPACFATAARTPEGETLSGRVVYTIRSTSRTGIELAFQPALAVRSLSVRIVGTTGYVPMPELGGEITLRGHPVGAADVAVEYRIALGQSPAAECVDLPVRVEVRPL